MPIKLENGRFTPRCVIVQPTIRSPISTHLTSITSYVVVCERGAAGSVCVCAIEAPLKVCVCVVCVSKALGDVCMLV